QAKTEPLEGKIAALKAQMKALQEIEVQLNKAPDKQLSLTDPDARSMKTRGTGIVGYNVQVAAEAKHHLIVAHEVTNIGIDRDQLSGMAKQARSAMGVQDLTVVPTEATSRAKRSWHATKRASALSFPRPRRPMPQQRAASARQISSTIPRPTHTAARLDNV